VCPGLPFGKAVLNLPVRRMPNAYSLPPGLKSFIAASGERFARKPSTRPEFSDDFSNTVCVRPSTGVPENVPPAKYQRLSIWLVTMSSLLRPSDVMDNQVGRCALGSLPSPSTIL